MTISQLFKDNKPMLSCEIFPPKEFGKVEEVKGVVSRIAALKPAYISVTYGASGNTPHFTRELSQYVQECGVPALSHLTCINSPIDKVNTVLDDLETAGVGNVLALRGDVPAGQEFPSDAHFTHASELIAAIKARGGFCVGAACYPEGHPEAENRDSDLNHLRRKQDMGADFFTTQMFFDNNVLYQFLYRALQKGVALPISAGIMPVVRAKQVQRIVALSGTSLPPRFLAIIDRFGNDPRSMEKAGVAYATDQIVDLIANGVNHIHLYTMNRPEIAAAIMHNLEGIL